MCGRYLNSFNHSLCIWTRSGPPAVHMGPCLDRLFCPPDTVAPDTVPLLQGCPSAGVSLLQQVRTKYTYKFKQDALMPGKALPHPHPASCNSHPAPVAGSSAPHCTEQATPYAYLLSWQNYHFPDCCASFEACVTASSSTRQPRILARWPSALLCALPPSRLIPMILSSVCKISIANHVYDFQGNLPSASCPRSHFLEAAHPRPSPQDHARL